MAPPKQLRCRDLRAGDIMLQFNSGNVIGKAIAFGQWLVGDKNTEIVHAGVMFDSHYMVEALKDGIDAHDLRIQNVAASYRVYRPVNGVLGATAGNTVKFLFDRHKSFGNLPYAYTGAVTSLGAAAKLSTSKVDRMVDDILNLKPTSFFCSQFVVMAYQLAAAQAGIPPKSVFALDDANMPPGRLATCCEQSFAFEPAGYMSANER